MDYKESDLPVHLKEGEYLSFDAGGSIRWESNGEAKDVFLDSGFSPTAELWPGSSYTVETGGHTLKLTATFEQELFVEKA